MEVQSTSRRCFSRVPTVFFYSSFPMSRIKEKKHPLLEARVLAQKAHRFGSLFGICSLLVAFAAMSPQVATAQFQGTETFSGPLSQAKWFPFTEGLGSISLSNQEFNFTSTQRFGEHEAGLSWVEDSVRNSQDWEFQVDVANSMKVTNSSLYSGVGIYVANANDERDLAFLEFYSTFFNDLGESVRGFTSGLQNNGVDVHEADTFELPFERGAVRVKFDSSERSLSFFYHTGETTEGYFWQFLSKYGVDGNDGSEGNANWLMSVNAEFDVGVYGLAQGTRSSIGQVTADNFTTEQPSLGLHEVDFEFESNIAASGDAVSLRWFSFEGLDYVVQSSNDLLTWSDMTTIVGTGRYAELEIPVNVPSAAVFYRIYSRLP